MPHVAAYNNRYLCTIAETDSRYITIYVNNVTYSGNGRSWSFPESDSARYCNCIINWVFQCQIWLLGGRGMKYYPTTAPYWYDKYELYYNYHPIKSRLIDIPEI